MHPGVPLPRLASLLSLQHLRKQQQAATLHAVGLIRAAHIPSLQRVRKQQQAAEPHAVNTAVLDPSHYPAY
jgi:hypothetical protein